MEDSHWHKAKLEKIVYTNPINYTQTVLLHCFKLMPFVPNMSL